MVCLDIKDIEIRPASGNHLKNIYLNLLLKFGYLNITECYEFIINFYHSDFDFSRIKEIYLSGTRTVALLDCKENGIEDGKIRLFISFLFPLKEFRVKFESKDAHEAIYINGEYGKNVIKIHKNFTTIFSFNNFVLMIFFTLLSYLSLLVDILNRYYYVLKEYFGKMTMDFIIVSNILLAIFTGIYVILTRKLVLETKRAREEQSKPNISIYVEQNGYNIDLIIKSIGSEDAFDLEFDIDPEFKNMHDTPLCELIPLKKGLSYLAPGKEIKIILTIFGRLVEYKDKIYIITVRYKDRLGKHYQKRFPIDFSGFMHPIHIPKSDMTKISENIEKISKDVAKIAERYIVMTEIESEKKKEEISRLIDEEISKEKDEKI